MVEFATVKPAGSVSLIATPVRATVLAAGLVIVKSRDDVAFKAIETGLNAIATDGGAFTIRLTVLLTAPATGVCVVVTPEVEFGFEPVALLVTGKVTVQLPLAGIVIPVKLKAVAPAPKVLGVVPTHVPPTAPPTALMFVSVSLNDPPVSAEPFELLKVNVTVELPPEEIVVGLKAFAIVGAAKTIRFGVLLPEPAVAVWSVVTPEVVLGFVPSVLLVTEKMTVQLPLDGIVIPLKLKAVAPPTSVFGVVPTQVPVTEPPAALIFANVSLNEPLVRADALELVTVTVTAEVPPL